MSNATEKKRGRPSSRTASDITEIKEPQIVRLKSESSNDQLEQYQRNVTNTINHLLNMKKKNQFPIDLQSFLQQQSTFFLEGLFPFYFFPLFFSPPLFFEISYTLGRDLDVLDMANKAVKLNDRELKQYEILKMESTRVSEKIPESMKKICVKLEAQLKENFLTQEMIDESIAQVKSNDEALIQEKRTELQSFKTAKDDQIDDIRKDAEEKIEKLKEEMRKKIEEHKSWENDTCETFNSFEKCMNYLSMEISDVPTRQTLYKEFDKFIGDKRE